MTLIFSSFFLPTCVHFAIKIDQNLSKIDVKFYRFFNWFSCASLFVKVPLNTTTSEGYEIVRPGALFVVGCSCLVSSLSWLRLEILPKKVPATIRNWANLEPCWAMFLECSVVFVGFDIRLISFFYVVQICACNTSCKLFIWVWNMLYLCTYLIISIL